MTTRSLEGDVGAQAAREGSPKPSSLWRWASIPHGQDPSFPGHSSQAYCDISCLSEGALVSERETDLRKAGQCTPTLKHSQRAWLPSDTRQKPQLSFLTKRVAFEFDRDQQMHGLD